MTNSPSFPLAVVANACSGAAALRAHLAAAGLDTDTVARLTGSSPLTIARATKTGATPRGLLIGMAALVTVVDRLAERGVSVADVAGGGGRVTSVLAEIADESPVAARTIEKLRSLDDVPEGPAQLSLPLHARSAA